jgi:dTDP-L-rhamnose 4-epimerase
MKLGNVFVTGGAGFIGRALSNVFAEKADRWVVMDSLHPQVHATQTRPAELHPSAELFIGDLTESQAWDGFFDSFKPDVVIHLAAETGTAQSMFESTRHAMVNVVGTTNLIDALGQAKVFPERVILTSSRAVYGEGQWVSQTGELCYPGIRSKTQFESQQWDFTGLTAVPSNASVTWPHPTSVYGATKLDQEHILSSWGAANDVQVTILRLQNVFGPGQSLTNPYTGIVSLFSQVARKGESIPLYEDGQIVRDFILINDVVSAIEASIDFTQANMVEIFDVGSGAASTIAQVAEWLSTHYLSPEPHLTGKYREGDVRFAACDISRTQEILGWNPRFSLNESLLVLQNWLNEELGNS